MPLTPVSQVLTIVELQSSIVKKPPIHLLARTDWGIAVTRLTGRELFCPFQSDLRSFSGRFTNIKQPWKSYRRKQRWWGRGSRITSRFGQRSYFGRLIILVFARDNHCIIWKQPINIMDHTRNTVKCHPKASVSLCQDNITQSHEVKGQTANFGFRVRCTEIHANFGSRTERYVLRAIF